MYITNIKALKNDLIQGPLPEKENIKYLLLFLALEGLGLILPPKPYNIWMFFSGLSSIIITLLGAQYCFKKNFGASGSHFLQRLLSIGLVVGIRISLVCIIPGLAIVILIARLVGDTHGGSTWYTCFVVMIVNVLIFWRIGYHIGQVSQKQNEENVLNKT
jgi:hypothetical protein